MTDVMTEGIPGPDTMSYQPLGPITRLSDQVTHSEKLRLVGLQIVGNVTLIFMASVKKQLLW